MTKPVVSENEAQCFAARCVRPIVLDRLESLGDPEREEHSDQIIEEVRKTIVAYKHRKFLGRTRNRIAALQSGVDAVEPLIVNLQQGMPKRCAPFIGMFGFEVACHHHAEADGRITGPWAGHGADCPTSYENVLLASLEAEGWRRELPSFVPSGE